uniref:Secreted protein n=1 Tax=Panagrellus redivivus TaxID=6233 RepID=A0A7E4VL60_PANRE
MQTRSLFAVLILGFAVGITYIQADDIVADLEELSTEELTHVLIETVKAVYAELDSESQLQGKLEIIAKFPQFPELKNFINLPFDEFWDKASKILIEKLPEDSSSEVAVVKKEFIDFIKILQKLQELEDSSEE